MPDQSTESALAELAIAVYVEELATDRRVLYVGDPESKGPERLAKVARSVDIVSPDARVRGTRRGGRVHARPWPGEGDLARWDVVLVPDLSLAGLAARAPLEQVGGWLAEGGVLVAGACERDRGAARGLEYEAFYELLQGSFDSVRMVGQAPFRGFSLVDLAPPGELEVTFDGSLLEGAEQSAERFVALCAAEEVVLDAYAVVQIPIAVAGSDAPSRSTPDESSGLEARLREQQEALDAANVHAEGLERELAEARGAGASSGQAKAGFEAERDALRERVEGLERALEGAQRALAEVPPLEDVARLEVERAELQRRLEGLEAERARPRSPGPGASEQEHVRLESALWERGRELTVLRAEVERRGTLVRDLVEELRESAGVLATSPRIGSPLAPAAPTPALEGSLDEVHRALERRLEEAAARAVALGAERAKLAFELDEARGACAVVEEAREGELEEMRRMEAALRGTVRGLNARLAEVTELFQRAQARLTLAEDDREAAAARCRGLERELAEARERVEFEIARGSTRDEVRALAKTVPPAQPAHVRDATLAAREGELLGALMRCQEEATDIALQRGHAEAQAEAARDALVALEERSSGMRSGYEARITELVSEMDRTGAEAERALVRAGELEARLGELERQDARLRGELMGTRMRLLDREEAVRALLEHAAAAAETSAGAHAGESPPLPAISEEELTRLRAEVEELRGQIDAGEPGGPSEEPSLLGARDAMIARLQVELSGAVEQTRRLERELERQFVALADRRDEVEAARLVAGVEVEESVRELEELTDRLEGSEAERKRAVEALGAAREILSRLLEELPALAESGAGGGEARELHARLSRTEAEAADREVLLRSMTAQLQERDDRIRALERFDPSDEEDPAALRVSLLEMEERVARLREELDNERRARRSLEAD